MCWRMLNKLEILLNRRNPNKIKEQKNLLLTTITPWKRNVSVTKENNYQNVFLT